MRSINLRKALSILSLSTALFITACGPDGGPSASADDGGATTADPGAGATTGASRFLGTWMYESGATLIACSDGSTEDIQAGGGTVTFTPGANGSRVVAVSDTNCAVACMISGSTATCEQGTCAAEGGTLTVQPQVFAVSGDKLQENMQIQFAGTDGSTCTLVLKDAVLGKQQ